MDAREKEEKIVLYLTKIVQDLETKNYEEIVKNINLLLEIDEKPDYYGIIGLAEFKLQNYESSINYLNRAIELLERADFYCNLGMAKEELGDKLGALAAYERASELNPNANYHSNIALVNFDLKKYDIAIEEYTKAIEVEPENDLYYGMRGLSKVRLGLFKDAIDDYKFAIKLNENEIEYCYRLANIYLELKDNENATIYYEKVLEFCDKQGDDILDALGVPYIVKCLLRYARVKVAQGDYQAAQDMLEKSIKKNPKFDVDNAGD